MNKMWTAHLQTEEEKQRFANQIYGAREVLARLRDIIDQKEIDLAGSERSKEQYENPNWPFLQAHRNGYASMLTAVKNLLTLKDQTQK